MEFSRASLGREPRQRPQSSPAKARPQSAFSGSRSKSRPHSAPAGAPRGLQRSLSEVQARWNVEYQEPIGKDWIRGDWTAGWMPNPVKEAFPRHTIPSSNKGRGDPGFRDTYLTIAARSKQHIPGPGAHKALKDFVLPATTEAFGKPDGRIKEKRWTPRHLRQPSEDTGANRTAPDPESEGDETDAKRLIRSRPASAQIPTAARNANLTDLRQATSGLPSSFHTPGPGAYTQFSCFGQPSGACTKKYLGTLPSNNPAVHGKGPKVFGGSVGASRRRETHARRGSAIKGESRTQMQLSAIRHSSTTKSLGG